MFCTWSCSRLDSIVVRFFVLCRVEAIAALRRLRMTGAEIIVLQLKSIDPNGKNASPEDAVKTVKKVRAAVDVPLVVWGSANVEKDEAVLKKVAEACQCENLVLGPVEDKNHKAIGAAAMGFDEPLCGG